MSKLQQLLDKLNPSQDIKDYILSLPENLQGFAVGKLAKEPNSSLNDIKEL